jgi:hypothetical protein
MLREDTFDTGRIRVSDVTYDDVLGGIAFIERHNIISSDAAILASYARHVAGRGENSLFIASDHRLSRAARREGFETLDPESAAPTDLPRLLANLS